MLFWKPKSQIRVWQSWAPSGDGEHLFFISSRPGGGGGSGGHVRFLDLWLRHSDVCLRLHSEWPSLYVSRLRYFPWTTRVIQDGLISRSLRQLQLQRFCFQIRSHALVLGVRMGTYLLGPPSSHLPRQTFQEADITKDM